MAIVNDPLWYKDAVIYELHVRAFYDSGNDGMGDFRGLTQKLDYLADLGVTAVWLLPYYPSPWRDDGYDIADYTAIHPAYGDMGDFKIFLRASHERGIRVINELVINHTSDQHPWFQRARTAKPGTVARDFYVWSDTPERYRDARIIFKDFESSNWAWDPVAQSYFWHRFYAHQPDLNFDSPAVHKAIFKVMDYWFKMGVDGMRLDAIPYLYEREGTNCENLPETHEFLKKLRAHLDENFEGRMFLAEANQWPEETVPYFGDGDECHMGFHFPVMPRLFMAIQMEDRFPIVDILEQTPPVPESCQWATFLRNHDELTLEMVTDEERDYMYRMYASDSRARINLGIRRRLAPLLGNNRRKIELMHALLFSLPGTPVLYYGDEIGMGDNIYLGDRNGVRTPMQWSPDRNAGFSRANAQQLYLPVIVDPEYHYQTVNVEAQHANPNSLLWWTKRFIALRQRFRAFGRGSIRFVTPDNRKVLAFLREYEDEHILVVANLSRFVQYSRLDLSAFAGQLPVELFGRTEFPPIGTDPYFLTLGPNAFYWFQLRPTRESIQLLEDDNRPARTPIEARGGLQELLAGAGRASVAPALQDFLLERRWFQGKAKTIRAVRVADAFELDNGPETAWIAFVEVDYVQYESETYVLPLALARGIPAHRIAREHPSAVIAPVDVNGTPAVLYDAIQDPAFRARLLGLTDARRRTRGATGEITGQSQPDLRDIARGIDGAHSRLVAAEQSNSSIIYGDAVVMKLFRRLEQGRSLDVEMGTVLTQRGFTHTPAVLGSIEYRTDGQERSVAVVQRFVHNEGDAWSLTLDNLGEYYERVSASKAKPARVASGTRALLAPTDDLPEDGPALVGTSVEDARLIGRRTAEMHAALAMPSDDPALAPEAFTMFYQRSLYQSMRNLAGRVLGDLATRIDQLPESVRDQATEVLSLEDELDERFKAVTRHRSGGYRIRCHGDYHLGQLLFTGRDFVITDFEGEPIRPLSERRLKRSPLRDVAGMLRSFHYAAHAALLEPVNSAVRVWDDGTMEAWARLWTKTVGHAFTNEYLSTAADAGFLPENIDDTATLLDACLLEKAVYELGYEMNNRPRWTIIPLIGLLSLLRDGASR